MAYPSSSPVVRISAWTGGEGAQDARVERIELAIEAVAIEIERLGESQRFTAKLLAERDRLQPGNVVASGLPSRVITPH